MISDFPELSMLSPEDKILLAAELWNEATEESDAVESDPGILDAIEERLEDFRNNPESVLSWDEVKERIRSNG